MEKYENIELLPALDRPLDVRELFSEYTKMLTDNDPAVREYLGIQNYDAELQHLEIKYGPPDGRLYLAYFGGRLAGCAGLRKISSESCEMKRFFVRPEFRGRRIGSCLAEKLISDAAQIGYKHMLLDTLPFLTSALHIYKRMGFYEIPCYNNSPMTNAIYMKLDLG